MTTSEYILLALGGAVALLIALCFRRAPMNQQKLKKTVTDNTFIYYKDFEKNWIVEGKDGQKPYGYKYLDDSGCYIITVYDRFVGDGNYWNYENIYIGQSVDVCQRVHDHFNGKGKGDIYADIKYGKHVYVQLILCGEKKMNALEKRLIRLFDATKSYNETKGGGKQR